MNIGFIGLGKLGLPVAVAIDLKGHSVMGYDLDKTRMSRESQPYQEAGLNKTEDFNTYLAESGVKFGSMKDVVEFADLIFIAVQTPHNPMYEGISPIPEKRVDFDYTYLKSAVKDLAEVIVKDIPVIVISTCLPGTMEREIKPLLNKHMKLVYNPFFIAMGTTMIDYLNPEFILMGVEDKKAAEVVQGFYATITNSPIRKMSIESAELTKVCYNTFISLKIAFVNTIMEICESIPKADVDSVTDALKQAHKRLISPAYLSGGMGDGGGCHPRDNIAMSWLARELGLSFDIFESAMMCREKQAKWLADILIRESNKAKLPIVILGYAFKPETNLTVGSPAILVNNFLSYKKRLAIMIDSRVEDNGEKNYLEKAVYLIGCRHKGYEDYEFPEGSIVIDPFRYVKKQDGVKILALGKGTKYGINE